LPLAELAYLEVLAVPALEVTIAEENRTGAVPACKRGLFTVMWAETAHDRPCARAAFAGRTVQPVDSTAVRAQVAGHHALERLFYSLAKIA